MSFEDSWEAEAQATFGDLGPGSAAPDRPGAATTLTVAPVATLAGAGRDGRAAASAGLGAIRPEQ